MIWLNLTAEDAEDAEENKRRARLRIVRGP